MSGSRWRGGSCDRPRRLWQSAGLPSRLTNGAALRKFTAASDEAGSPELAFALGATPASLAEALRQDDTDLAGAGGLDDLYPRLQELAPSLPVGL